MKHAKTNIGLHLADRFIPQEAIRKFSQDPDNGLVSVQFFSTFDDSVIDADPTAGVELDDGEAGTVEGDGSGEALPPISDHQLAASAAERFGAAIEVDPEKTIPEDSEPDREEAGSENEEE